MRPYNIQPFSHAPIFLYERAGLAFDHSKRSASTGFAMADLMA